MFNHIRDWGENGPSLWFEDSDSDADSDRMGQNFADDHIIMEPLKILAWNARGAASQEFCNTFGELMTKYKPNVVFICETRVGGHRAEAIMSSLGLPCSIRVDPMGFSGGLWLLWNNENVKISVHSQTFQEIHATIEVPNSPFSLLSFVYASPQRDRRFLLWENLKSIADSVSIP